MNFITAGMTGGTTWEFDVVLTTPPRPSGRRPHWAPHLADLATKPGEKCGFDCQWKMVGEIGWSSYMVV